MISASEAMEGSHRGGGGTERPLESNQTQFCTPEDSRKEETQAHGNFLCETFNYTCSLLRKSRNCTSLQGRAEGTLQRSLWHSDHPAMYPAPKPVSLFDIDSPDPECELHESLDDMVYPTEGTTAVQGSSTFCQR